MQKRIRAIDVAAMIKASASRINGSTTRRIDCRKAHAAFTAFATPRCDCVSRAIDEFVFQGVCKKKSVDVVQHIWKILVDLDKNSFCTLVVNRISIRFICRGFRGTQFGRRCHSRNIDHLDTGERVGACHC
jgi:hypothetical protein